MSYLDGEGHVYGVVRCVRVCITARSIAEFIF